MEEGNIPAAQNDPWIPQSSMTFHHIPAIPKMKSSEEYIATLGTLLNQKIFFKCVYFVINVSDNISKMTLGKSRTEAPSGELPLIHQGPAAGSDLGLSLRSETETDIMVSPEIVSDLETESVARSQGHTYLS